jgi:hypothetical protein
MKKIILTVILILMVAFMVCGCGATEDRSETIENDGRSIYSVDISKRETLVYDTNTRIVYISQYTYNGNSVYTLYLSENGFPYRYVDGRLVEVGQ